MTDRATLTIEEAAHVLGISRGLCYEMVRIGRLPVIRLGRRLVVPRVRLEAILAAAESPSSPPIDTAS